MFLSLRKSVMREEERWIDKEGGMEGEMDEWGASNIWAAEGCK